MVFGTLLENGVIFYLEKTSGPFIQVPCFKFDEYMFLN